MQTAASQPSPTAPDTADRGPVPWRVAAAVGALATAVRTVAVLLLGRTPESLADPMVYLRAGESIARGDGYRSLLGEPTAYYPPGYPFFVGAVQRLSTALGLGDHVVLLLGLVQAVLGGLAAAALVVAGVHLVQHRGRPAALRLGTIAGLTLALWPNLVVHSAVVLSETLFVAVFCVLLAALFVWSSLSGAADQPGAPWRTQAVPATVVVLTSAGCVWIRPQSVLLLAPALAIGWWLGGRSVRTALTGAALVASGLFVATVPWTIRNSVVMGSPVPFSTNAGDNLCIGFHDGATGGFMIAGECATEGRYVDGPPVEVDRDRELRDRTTEWIASHPLDAVALSWPKLVETFSSDHDGRAAVESYGEDPFLASWQRSMIDWTSDLYYWSAAVAASLGAVLIVRGRLGVRGASGTIRGSWSNGVAVLAIVLSGALVPVLSFGDARFKVSIVPALALLAAVPLSSLSRSRSRADGGVGDGGTHGASDVGAGSSATPEEMVQP